MELSNTKLWTALVTPFNNDLSVDWDSFQSLIQEQVDAKNGLLVLGSTGEALNISLADRKKIVEYAISLNPTSPIMIGVGGLGLAETREWVSYLNTQKLDAYLMVTPLYSKPGDEGQYEWFGYQVGDGVENFTLQDQHGQMVELHSFCGQHIMLVIAAYT